MTKRKQAKSAQPRLLLQHLRELRMMLHEMNQKLDHLIQSCRRFYFTTDFTDSDSSHSPNHRFKG